MAQVRCLVATLTAIALPIEVRAVHVDVDALDDAALEDRHAQRGSRGASRAGLLRALGEVDAEDLKVPAGVEAITAVA